ncbi:MAG: site-2 protease family protein [Armatimonadota bacterium]
MSWSWKIGSYRGIAVYIHATFLLIVGWILAIHLLQGHGWGVALLGVVFILMLFACVVLHEFGHALTAQRYGIDTRDITLYPIGGIARLERIPREPSQELTIALAGPAVNVVIAAVLWVLLSLTGTMRGWEVMLSLEGNLFARLLWVNLFLALFNLLPAFPMDGGRVLRALLATRMPYERATNAAATVGQAMAFLFGFLGLMGNPMLLFIAFFVYMGAGQEAATVQAELAFRGVPVSGAMMTQFGTLSPQSPLAVAVDRLLAGAQHDYPVVDEEGAVVGILTRSALIEALEKLGPEGRIFEAMKPAPAPVHPDQWLEDTFQQMREQEAQSIPVVRDGRLVGLLTMENVGELLMVRTAVLGNLRGPGGGPTRALEELHLETETQAESPAPRRRWLPSRRARG